MPKQKLQCPFCPKISSRGTGLASHIRGRHSAEYSNWSKGRKGVAKTEDSVSIKAGVAGGLKDIIARLEQRKTSIDRALSALRELEVSPLPASHR
jgi:hypothetical protein